MCHVPPQYLKKKIVLGFFLLQNAFEIIQLNFTHIFRQLLVWSTGYLLKPSQMMWVFFYLQIFPEKGLSLDNWISMVIFSQSDNWVSQIIVMSTNAPWGLPWNRTIYGLFLLLVDTNILILNFDCKIHSLTNHIFSSLASQW